MTEAEVFDVFFDVSDRKVIIYKKSTDRHRDPKSANGTAAVFQTMRMRLDEEHFSNVSDRGNIMVEVTEFVPDERSLIAGSFRVLELSGSAPVRITDTRYKPSDASFERLVNLCLNTEVAVTLVDGERITGILIGAENGRLFVRLSIAESSVLILDNCNVLRLEANPVVRPTHTQEFGIRAEAPGAYVGRTFLLTRNLGWATRYIAFADRTEGRFVLRGVVDISNDSGLFLPNAQIVLANTTTENDQDGDDRLVFAASTAPSVSDDDDDNGSEAANVGAVETIVLTGHHDIYDGGALHTIPFLDKDDIPPIFTPVLTLTEWWGPHSRYVRGGPPTVRETLHILNTTDRHWPAGSFTLEENHPILQVPIPTSVRAMPDTPPGADVRITLGPVRDIRVLTSWEPLSLADVKIGDTQATVEDEKCSLSADTVSGSTDLATADEKCLTAADLPEDYTGNKTRLLLCTISLQNHKDVAVRLVIEQAFGEYRLVKDTAGFTIYPKTGIATALVDVQPGVVTVVQFIVEPPVSERR